MSAEIIPLGANSEPIDIAIEAGERLADVLFQDRRYACSNTDLHFFVGCVLSHWLKANGWNVLELDPAINHGKRAFESRMSEWIDRHKAVSQ